MATIIRVLSLDCWDTVLSSSTEKEHAPLRQAAVKKWLARRGIQIDENTFEQMWQECNAGFWKTWEVEHRTISTPERIDVFLKRAGVEHSNEDVEEITAHVEAASLSPVPDLTPGFKAIIHSLPRSIKFALISDTGWSSGVTIRKLLDAHGLLDRFACLVFSDEMGCAKPKTEMFKKVIHTLQVPAEEILHIGDIERTDVEGALAAGMKTALYTGEVDRRNGTDSRADFVLNHWSGLEDILEELASY